MLFLSLFFSLSNSFSQMPAYLSEPQIPFLDEQVSRLIYEVRESINNPYLEEELQLEIEDELIAKQTQLGNNVSLLNISSYIRYKKINVRGKVNFIQISSSGDLEDENRQELPFSCKSLYLINKQNEELKRLQCQLP